MQSTPPGCVYRDVNETIGSFPADVMALPAIETSEKAPAATQDETHELAAALRGDRSGFSALVRRYQQPVYSYCFRLMQGDAAEARELAQDTFLRAYQSLARFDPHRPFGTWLLSIARNRCIDVLRQRGQRPTEGLEEVIDTVYAPPVDQPDLLLLARQERDSLLHAVASLSLEHREVIELYYVQQHTTKAIATLLNVPAGTVMARLFRAREKLRAALGAAEVSA